MQIIYKERKYKIMKMKKLLTLFTVIAVTGVLTAGCGEAPASDGVNAGADTGETVSGTVKMNGSTSMQKLVEAACEVFNEKYPSVTASGQFTGSGTGIEAVANGTADIGNSSRALKDEEKAAGLEENIIAIDGIAIITDKANAVANLTSEQLAKIYTGEIKNWSEVGGANGAIVVIGREAGSGTRGAFEEILKIADKCSYAQELDQTGAVLTTVASTPNAIGYISLDVLNDSVAAVEIDGVEPTVENIKSGAYPLQRPFVMATKGGIEEQSDAVRLWFDFMKSADGKAIIENVGLINVG